jgi:hypothetical protein
MHEGKNMGIMTTLKKPTAERGGDGGQPRVQPDVESLPPVKTGTVCVGTSSGLPVVGWQPWCAQR